MGNESANVETVNGATITYAYSYDELKRLTQVANGTASQQENYQYDPLNNRTQKSVGQSGPTITAYVHDAANELTAIRAGSQGGPLIATLAYDANGNLSSDGTRSYTWDAIDQLAQVSAGATTVQYGSDGTAQYYLQDGLGSVLAVADSADSTVATQRFDAWGNRIASTGTIAQYGYTGREPDETGLIFYRARYYNPAIGRFVSRDPAGFAGGLNFYAYCGNGPTLCVDPSGMLWSQALNAVSPYWGAAKQAATDLGSGISGDYRSVMEEPSMAYDIGTGVRAVGAFGISLLPGSSLPDVGSAAGQGDYGTAAILLSTELLGPLGKEARAAGALERGAANEATAYSVAFETKIPELGMGTRPEHFKAANEALDSAIRSDTSFAQMAEELGIQVPANRGTSPANWTWHHVPDQPGVLQLVPRSQHQWGSLEQPLLHPGGKGGFSIWGAGY